VITGFRHDLGGYQALCGVHPDLTTLGKAIANGFPLAAIGGRREHMERLNTTADGDVHFGGTYNGNAAAVEAGLATIEQLEDGRVHEHVFALGERMRRGLVEVAERVGVPAVVGGFGAARNLRGRAANDDALFGRYRRELITRGIVEMPESLGRSHIGAAHTTDDIDRSLQAAEESLRAAVKHR
jgi:glutamate-1-semialdehyde 2,1-aminomutase